MKTILVTAIGSFAGEAVIRHLKEQGYRVLGCDIYPAGWVVNAGDVERFFQAPYATEREAYLAFLHQVCESEGVDGLIPLTDTEVDVLTGSDFRDPGKTRLLISGRRTIEICRDKSKSEQYLNSLGIGRTIPGIILEQVQPADLEYPVVVKPKDGRSSQNLRMIRSSEEMRHLQQELGVLGGNYLVQSKLEGYIITVDVVRNPEDGAVVCLSRREYLRTANGGGLTVEIFQDEALDQLCRQIAEALDIRGCVNFEFIEAAPGTWYFLECNPRFSGGVAFSCMAGYDMVNNHLRCFTGEKLEVKPQISGQYLARRYTEYRMKTGEPL